MSDLNLIPLWQNDQDGEDQSSILRVCNFPYTIGRDPNCDHCVDNPVVSRWHCILSMRDDQIRVADLGSKNGTRVNGQLLAEPHALADGDTLALAYYTFLVCLGRIPLEAHVDQFAVVPEC